MVAASHDPIGVTLSNGRYVIQAKLGEGGMGAVYRAIDLNLEFDVVIKLLHPSMVTDAEFSRRFRDEVRSLVRLSHPHIVKLTDVGDWDGVPFAVLQFLPGGSLGDRLAVWRGPAALGALVSWLGPVSSALDYVHSQKMVHRDVKPDNILFDGQGHPFLGDFGVVKVLTAAADPRASRTAMTGTGMVLGTPHYMAPELIMGDPFDGRVDQYALAVTAYELLCGRRPFEHEVPTRVLMMQTQDAPPSLTSLCPWVSPRLEAALFKGLAKAPNDRYATCAAFSAALVEASGLAQAGQARVRCESCGQTMKVAVEILAKLSRAGRSAPCPRCQSPLNLATGTATVMPPSLASERSQGQAGTAVLDVRGSTGAMQTLRPRGATSPPGTGTGTGTVVFGGAPAGQAAGRRPGTVADRGDEPERPLHPWTPFGLAAAITFVACAALFLVTSSGRPENLEPSLIKVGAADEEPPPTEPRGDLVAWNGRKDASILRPLGPMGSAGAGLGTQPPVTPSPLPVKPAAESAAPAHFRPSSQPSRPAAPAKPGGSAEAASQATGDDDTGAAEDKVEGAGMGVASAAISSPPGQGQGGPTSEPEPVADDEHPSQRNVPLGQLLSNPEPFAGKLMTLEQVYCLGKTPWRRADGSLRVALIESDLELTANSAHVRLGDTFELGLDRRLADQLIRQGKMTESADSPPTTPDWIMQPANLTVKVPSSSERGHSASARIVRVELFERFKNEVRGSAKKHLIVLFETQTITAAGAWPGLGNNDEWQKVKKLGHAYNQFQRFFESIQRYKSQAKWAAFDNQLNRLIGDGLRQSIAAQAATQRQIQEMMTPRSPR